MLGYFLVVEENYFGAFKENVPMCSIIWFLTPCSSFLCSWQQRSDPNFQQKEEKRTWQKLGFQGNIYVTGVWEYLGRRKKNDQGNIYCPLALIFSWESLGKLHNHLDSVALSLVMCKTIAPMCWGKGGRSIYHLRTHRTPGFRISSPWTAHCLWAVFKAELVCNQ